MISHFDHETIVPILSPAFSVVTGYGLDSNPEERKLLRDYIEKIASSESIENLAPPNTLPVSIQTALSDITFYLYSTNPRVDFFRCPSSLTAEGFKDAIQPYIRNMLKSMVYYLDDKSNTNFLANDIDPHIIKILRPDLFAKKVKNKTLLSFKETITHANAALNDEQNITVYRSIQSPVEELKKMRSQLENTAYDQQRIVLEQRLSLLEYMGFIDYQKYQGLRPEQRRRDVQNRLQDHGHVPDHLVFQNVSIGTLLMFLAVPAVAYRYLYFNQPPSRPRMERPVWPAGMLDLQNSTARFAWMDDSSIKMTSFENVVFPYAGQSFLQINEARSAAKREEISIGIHQAMNKMHQLLEDKSRLFIESYVYIWAFLAEHGRDTALGASLGGRFGLSKDEQLEIRALEALRVGLEQLFKHYYPKHAAKLSCLRGNTPEEQTIALDKMIAAEKKRGSFLYQERNQVLYDWYQILDQHKIPHWPLKVSESIKPSASRTMHAVMADAMCPWWQAPLKYIMNTAGGIDKMLCVRWQASAHPPLKSAEKIVETRTPHARSNLG